MKNKFKALVDNADLFLGGDHHKGTSYLTIKDRQGEIIKKGSIKTSREELVQFIDQVKTKENPPRIMAVIECGRAYRPMWRWLCEEVDEVLLAHPGALKIISDTVYKDDKIDSGKLADLLMLGLIPESHAASDEAWNRRMLLRHRVSLVKMQTAIKNRIHVIVDFWPEAWPPRPNVTDLFGRVGLDWLKRVELPPVERHLLDELLEVLEFLGGLVARSDAMVRKIVREDPRCRLLKSIPGIGEFFAALIMAEVDDIGRFPTPEEFASYTGLIPWMDSSAGKDRGGKIHKRGNQYLRWALVEAAVPATKSNLALKNVYDRICAKRGKKEGPNIAKVAVARRLSHIVYRILKEKRSYEHR